jgi:hypothetical protein
MGRQRQRDPRRHGRPRRQAAHHVPRGRDLLPHLRPQLHRHVVHRELPALNPESWARARSCRANGIDQGYRWSYTKFDYSNLNARPAGSIDVSFRIRNVGAVAGSDVAQVYLGPSSQLPAGMQQAVGKLAQFHASRWRRAAPQI